MGSWKFTHTNCEVNIATHALAKLVVIAGPKIVWLEETSSAFQLVQLVKFIIVK